jgi:hypothetical protein
MTASETTAPTLALHRADCGCVGFRTSEFFMLILKPCDGNNEHGFFLRGYTSSTETFDSVPATEAQLTVQEIQRLIADGYRLRELKAILRGGE